MIYSENYSYFINKIYFSDYLTQWKYEEQMRVYIKDKFICLQNGSGNLEKFKMQLIGKRKSSLIGGCLIIKPNHPIGP